MLKERQGEKLNLVAFRDYDDSLTRKDTFLRSSTNDGESALAHGASRLNLGPLRDTYEAKVVIAAVDLASD